MSQDSDCEHDNKRRRVSESESEIDETLDFLSIPEYATLAQKIIAGGGFGKAQTPGEGDRTYKLHNGLSHFLTAHDDDAITFTGKDGKPPSAKTKLSDKKEAYFQPLIDGERHYSVLFGKTSTRREILSQYGYKTNANINLANVSQDDISAFQGRAPFSMDTEGTPLQVPMTEQWESFEDSVLYGMMDKCFCKELAMQTSTKWMSSAHVNGSEDPKYVNKYIRSRVGDLDNDDPFDKNKGLLKTSYKTNLSFPFTKVEALNGYRPCQTGGEENPVFDFLFPLDENNMLQTKFNQPEIFKLGEDDQRIRATAEELLADFPTWEEKRSVPMKHVMLIVQYEFSQNSFGAAPGLRCVVKKMYYKMAKAEEQADALAD